MLVEVFKKKGYLVVKEIDGRACDMTVFLTRERLVRTILKLAYKSPNGTVIYR